MTDPNVPISRLSQLEEEAETEEAKAAAIDTLAREQATIYQSHIRLLGWGAAVICLLVLSATTYTVLTRVAFNHLADNIQDARTGACLQDNDGIRRHNDLVDANLAGLDGTEAIQTEINNLLDQQLKNIPPEALENPEVMAYLSLVAEQKQVVAEQIVLARALIEGTHNPLRDCTPHGIAVYLGEET